MKAIVYIIALSCLFAQSLSGQKEETANPIELPNFVIEGVEQLNVSSGVKQQPRKIGVLSKKEIDSLNSLEKQQSLLLPPTRLPEKSVTPSFNKGYLNGNYGRFNTPSLELGYEFRMNEYNFYANAALEYSGGHQDGADYTKTGVNMNLDYIASDKFWIFGGSKTRTSLKFGNKDYKLYANSARPLRNNTALDLRIDSDGKYDGALFSTGASISTDQLQTNAFRNFDNGIDAYLSVLGTGGSLNLGCSADISLHNNGGEGIHYLRAGLLSTIVSDKYNVDLNAGIEYGEGSLGGSKTALGAGINLEYFINPLFTLKTKISTGLDKLGFGSLFEANPYLSDTLGIIFPHNIINIGGLLYYHPSERFGATGGINFKMYEDWRYFTNIDTGYFQVSYVKAYIPSIFMECFYLPAENSRFVGNITFTAPTSDDGKILPYYSPVQISVYYRHLWIKNFGTTAGLDYTGERYTDLANTSKIGGFVNVYIAADYKLFKDISVSCRLDNLTNSDIYIWNGYKERGIYFELGISWQF